MEYRKAPWPFCVELVVQERRCRRERVLGRALGVRANLPQAARRPTRYKPRSHDLEAITKGASVSEVAIRLLVAVLAGGLIGWDRERLDKPAGLRTHMLVALGSCSFTLLGFEVSGHLANRTDDEFDPTRVLQGVIGGIGFLGAGTIIQSRGRVSGITTAASVWVAGSLGAAAGVGAYVLTAATALFAFVILTAIGLSQKLAGNPKPIADADAEPSSDSSGTKGPRSRPGSESAGNE